MLSQLDSFNMWSADYVFSVLQNICVTPQFKGAQMSNTLLEYSWFSEAQRAEGLRRIYQRDVCWCTLSVVLKQ